MTRLGMRAAVVAAALIVPAASAAGAERCCFLVDARVSGQLSLAAGADLEVPGASAYHARWRWRVRHVARYVEHGRIFNALTRFGSVPRRALSIRLSEERAALRGPTCRRQVSRDVAGRSERAYVSLEDTTEGRIALVVRAGHPALRSRCSNAFAMPTAHVHPAPAGMVLRQARALSLAWRDPIRFEDGRLVGSAEVRVRLVAVRPTRVAGAFRSARAGDPPRLSPRRFGPRLARVRAREREGPDREVVPRVRGRGGTRASSGTSGRGLDTSRNAPDDERPASGGSR